MASRSINRLTILGNLTRDPELKYTPSGAPVCTFGVATNRSWTTQDGQTREETQYHRVVAWHKLAELCAKLLSKGRKVFCEGRIVYRSFTGKDGQQRNITEMVLDDFIVFGDGRRPAAEEDALSGTPQASESTPASDEETPSEEDSEESKKKGKKKTEKEKDSSDETESVNPDDIPF